MKDEAMTADVLELDDQGSFSQAKIPTCDAVDTWADLERLALEATPGPWVWHTSCSWRRLKHDSRGLSMNVAEPFVASDGHPDLTISRDDMDFIAAANPATVLKLIEAARGGAGGYEAKPNEPSKVEQPNTLAEGLEVGERDKFWVPRSRLDAARAEAAGLRAALTIIAGKPDKGGERVWDGNAWVPFRHFARLALEEQQR